MTEAELIHLIKTGSGRDLLTSLAPLDESERRDFAPTVRTIFQRWRESETTSADNKKEAVVLADRDGLRVALLATATLSELKRLGSYAVPWNISLSEVMRILRPDWLDHWVDYLIEDSPYYIARLEPLWKDGLCARPECDQFILGYYEHHNGTYLDRTTSAFLDKDVWRFFEVEGSGEFSLASHDKYTSPEHQWSTILIELARRGRLDRDRLLDASLDVLERDFGQFRAGWYSRFHLSLAPTLDEQANRVERYLRLLSSSVPPSVSFALKALKGLDKANRLCPARLISALAPALQARQKSSATAALQLLASAARREPERAAEAARLAANALISEATEVQSRALDLIEKLGAATDDEVRASLQAHAELVAPSLRDRIFSLAKADKPAGPEEDTQGQPILLPKVQAILPCESLDAALEAYLEVLEEPRDPFAVERAVDGLAQYGAGVRAISDKLSPLAKRARQILGRPEEGGIRCGLALTGRSWCEGIALTDPLSAEFPEAPRPPVSPQYYANAFIVRNGEILDHVLSGHSVPMLSLPSDTTGQIAPGDLVERMAVYREKKLAPGRMDLSLAFLRLGHKGRETACAALKPKTEAERALAFALGADEAPNGEAALWVAAWGARNPEHSDAQVQDLVGCKIADAGTPAVLEMIVEQKGTSPRFWSVVKPHFWCVIKVQVNPAPQPNGRTFLTNLFLPLGDRHESGANPCGWVYSDIAWASLVWPSRSEAFFSRALLALDTEQKLSDHPSIAYLEPLFRPGAKAGPLARATLAYYLASTDKSIIAMTEEAIVTQVALDRLDPDDFATAVRPFITNRALPTSRWTRSFATIATFSAAHALFVRQVITRLLDFAPDDMPRDFGGMIELLFELHTAAATTLDDPVAKKSLKGISSSGKAGCFSRRLLEMTEHT